MYYTFTVAVGSSSSDIVEAYAGTLNGDVAWVPTSSAAISNIIGGVDGDYVCLNSVTGFSNSYTAGDYVAVGTTINDNGFHITDGFVQIDVTASVTLDSGMDNAGWTVTADADPVYVKEGDSWSIDVELTVTAPSGTGNLVNARTVVPNIGEVEDGEGVIASGNYSGSRTFTITISGTNAETDSIELTTVDTSKS